MGDFRASIKISFESIGLKFEQEWWINYFPDEDTGVDRRIIAWLVDTWEKCMSKYHEDTAEYEETQAKNEQEEKDLIEYKRLKAKYEH